jgi:hypothetical protein
MQRVSIGPITSATMAKLGKGEWKPTLEAVKHDIPGLVEALSGSAARG